MDPTPDLKELGAVDLERIALDLAGVEAALARLEAGTYFVDEVTGEPLDARLLADQPTTRRAPAS